MHFSSWLVISRETVNSTNSATQTSESTSQQNMINGMIVYLCMKKPERELEFEKSK